MKKTLRKIKASDWWHDNIELFHLRHSPLRLFWKWGIRREGGMSLVNWWKWYTRKD